MKKHLALFLFLTCFIFACRKYEDGPALTFLTKKERASKDWILDVAIQNVINQGIDQTSIYPEMRMRLRKDSAIIIFSPVVEKLYGTWGFTESKEAFTWTVDHTPITVIEGSTYDSLGRFDIKRLTKDQFWLVDKFNNELRFVPE